MERSKNNYHLIAPPKYTYKKEINRMVAEAGCRTRKDSVMMVETLITASPEFMNQLPPEEQKAYFQTALDFISERVGKQNILSAVVHMDERTPHMHLCFVPITPDNKLSAKAILGKTSVAVVNKKTMSEWYSESKAVACLMDTGCFAYIDNKLCVYDKKYIERDDKGKLYFTKYAQEHEEECFLQFVVDENGKLHYVTLPESMASKSYNYSDEIDEDIVRKHGLVNEISTEMLAAINGMDFGQALEKLMSKQICGFSVGLLKSTTGLDNRTVSNMRSGKNLTKVNVVSACLGIHVPFPVSSRMLELADLSNRLDVGGAKGDENMIYDQLLHLNWAWDYSDTYDDLVEQSYEYLIHQPPM